MIYLIKCKDDYFKTQIYITNMGAHTGKVNLNYDFNDRSLSD